MKKENIENLKIEYFKRKLISSYVYFLLFILIIYSLIFYFIIRNHTLAAYIFFGFCILLYTWLIIRKNYSIKATVHTYLILASLFDMSLILYFNKSTVANYIWLIPIPLAAYIFFSRRQFILYTLYVIINIITGYILSTTYTFDFPILMNENQLLLSDTVILFFNLCVIFLLLYYNDKIRTEEIALNFEHQKEDLPAVQTKESNENEFVKYNSLFEKIEKMMTEENHFKESDFNASKLSVLLNTNVIYISKAIKQNRFMNFTTYLNTHRINYFKKIISENNLQKITLMYLYIESGFSNQSTFNRVFKQIEGITPSEYISQLESDQSAKN